MFDIPGLLYIPDYLSLSEHDSLVAAIDAQPWSTDLSRRTQQYGYTYEHKKALLHTEQRLGPLPDWLDALGVRLVEDGLMGIAPDQAILNEYEPGQGIGKHIDAAPAFGPAVVSVSLLSTVVMELKHKADESVASVSVALAPRSALVLRGPARYEWRHGVAARRTDVLDGTPTPRSRRISVTFRTVPSITS